MEEHGEKKALYAVFESEAPANCEAPAAGMVMLHVTRWMSGCFGDGDERGRSPRVSVLR